MKSLKFLAAGIFLFSTSVLTAQKADNSLDRSPSFGVKGGVNFTHISGADEFSDTKSRTSFHVGVVGELPLTDMFSLQAEALYSGQGYDATLDLGLLGNRDYEMQLDYIQVPILAKVYLTRGLSVEAGPQFSFLINEEVDFRPEDDAGDIDMDDAKSFDFGIAAGLTFQTEMGLFATGRYSYGLTDIYDNVDARNTVFQIGIGYKF